VSSCKLAPALQCRDGLWLGGAWRGTQIGTCLRLALFFFVRDRGRGYRFTSSRFFLFFVFFLEKREGESLVVGWVDGWVDV
jgi:hypothetical protein